MRGRRAPTSERRYGLVCPDHVQASHTPRAHQRAEMPWQHAGLHAGLSRLPEGPDYQRRTLRICGPPATEQIYQPTQMPRAQSLVLVHRCPPTLAPTGCGKRATLTRGPDPGRITQAARPCTAATVEVQTTDRSRSPSRRLLTGKSALSVTRGTLKGGTGVPESPLRGRCPSPHRTVELWVRRDGRLMKKALPD